MRSTVTEGSRLFTRSFVRLWIFAFVAFLSAFQLFPTIPFRIIELGGTKAQAGWFLATYTYASAFAAPVMGALADRLGRKRIVTTACFLFIAFSLLYGVITWLPLLLLLALVHGAVWSAILSSNAALISEYVPESRRTEGMAYYGMASTAAVSIAPGIGLLVYKSGWMALCIGMAALSVVMLFLVRGIYDTSERVAHDRLSNLVAWRVVVVAMSLFLVAFGYGGVTSFVALLSHERGIDPHSLFFTVFAISILVMRILTARLGDRFGHRVLLYPSLLIIPPALLLLGFADGRASITVSAILFGLGFGGAYPAFITFVLGRTDPRRRGSTFGSVIWAFDTGIGTGSLVTGMVVEAAGYGVAFAIGAAVAVAALPVFVMTSRLLTGGGAIVAPSSSHAEEPG
ncbi:MAG: MFS transporter [Thermoanaerobaculia bacterium]